MTKRTAPKAGDQIRILQNFHSTTLVWMTATQVLTIPDASYPDPEYPHLVALEYVHVVDGDTCFHSGTTRINDHYRDRADFITDHRTN